MNTFNKHVLIKVLHTLFLEEFHFIITVVGLKKLSIECLERSAQISHIAWLVSGFERSDDTCELPKGSLIISLLIIMILLAEQIECLAAVSATLMEIVLLHVQEAKVIAEYVERLNREQFVLH